jgi:hypothetical protein
MPTLFVGGGASSLGIYVQRTCRGSQTAPRRAAVHPVASSRWRQRRLGHADAARHQPSRRHARPGATAYDGVDLDFSARHPARHAALGARPRRRRGGCLTSVCADVSGAASRQSHGVRHPRISAACHILGRHDLCCCHGRGGEPAPCGCGATGKGSVGLASRDRLSHLFQPRPRSGAADGRRIGETVDGGRHGSDWPR